MLMTPEDSLSFTTKTNSFIEKLSVKLEKNELLQILYQGIQDIFHFSDISIYLFDPTTSLIDSTYPFNDVWSLPEDEIKWLIKRTRNCFIGNTSPDTLQDIDSDIDYIYVKNRRNNIFSNKLQLLQDIEKYQYECSDGLYWILISEAEILLGIIFINNWSKKSRLSDDPNFTKHIGTLRQLMASAATAADNLFMNKKIESLLTDKQQMKERIQKEEEDLRNRILELSVLYDTSNSMGHSINYYQIITLLQEAVYKVLKADLCTIFLLDYPGGEIFLRVNNPVSEEIRLGVHNNILAVMRPFIKNVIDRKRINFTTEEMFDKNTPLASSDNHIKSFTNIPLVFKDEILGMLNVCSTTANAFSKNEITFLHTIANQLSLNIGRLRIVKALEKSKIGTMVASMAEGVIMLDENNHLETINPAARSLMGLPMEGKISTEDLVAKFAKLDLISLYYDALYNGESVLNREIVNEDKILSANVTPVMDISTQKRVGMVMVLRDVTEWQKINRIKAQRLEIISRVNLIINSISDLENLLTVLMEFVLSVANSEMGSIQLKEKDTFHTKVHSNFPDKIRKDYHYLTGETISERVISKKEIVFIENYPQNNLVNTKTKILIEYYLAIPIIVKNDLLGVVNIVKKKSEDQKIEMTLDDIQTLTTITSLSGTAIYNAILYQDNLKKEKMDQELRLAHEIQNKLLPQSLPQTPKVSFGAISVPARAIGGDYYDFFILESGNIGIVIADIVGKGVPAALLMVMVKSIMQTNITHLDSPGIALKKMNTILYKDPVFNKYVPTFYGVLNPETLIFRYCNAGHEPGLLFSNNTFSILDTMGFPLGAWDDSEYEEKEILLTEGDIITLFTDGITETRNIEDEDYGIDRLREIIFRLKSLHAPDIIAQVYHKLEEYMGAAEQHDDLTMVVIKSEKKQKNAKCVDSPIETIEIKTLSAKKNISMVRNSVEEIAKKAGFTDEDIFNIKLVINEAQVNILEHAYHGDETGEIIFRFITYADRLEIMIKDFGKGIDTKTIKGENHLDELEGSGLGVFLINQLMDKVDYQRIENVGTELWLTKYILRDEIQ